MNVTQHVQALVLSRLREKRIVVWYDGEADFRTVFLSLDGSGLTKVDGSSSVLSGRREADRAWRRIFDPGSTPVPLLVYVPWRRASDEDARRTDPFEPFALAGTTVGDSDSERLQSIARQVLAGRVADVDRLFAEGRPTVSQLDALAGGTRYPLVLGAFETDVPSRVAMALVCDTGSLEARVASDPGLVAEVGRLLRDGFGLPEPYEGPQGLAQWILFSEFAVGLESAIPESLTHVPRAPLPFARPILDLCHALRDSVEHRDRYRAMAREVERRLGLDSTRQAPEAFARGDTFPCQDRVALSLVQERLTRGDREGARRIIREREQSVWRTAPDRDQLWRLAERVLDLLEAGAAWKARPRTRGASVADQMRAYAADASGFWRVDQASRLLEQAAAMLQVPESLSELLRHARQEYRGWIDAVQAEFLDAVASEGWPPEGLPRHDQAWARHGAPAVSEGRRTAWFLVDALRYEMGLELSRRLGDEGAARVEAASGVVPAATAFGMAALLPGAESALSVEIRDGTLVPLLGGRLVLTADDRREVFRASFGDRFASVRLGELLQMPSSQLRERIGTSAVLAVMSSEIDAFGEQADPLQARRYMSGILADLLAAASRLVDLGFERLVFVADHGFVQLPETLPGTACPEPPGTWVLRKRRALLGSLGGRGEDVVTFDASSVGIQGPVRHVCVPRGMRTFREGCLYFHEGVSLQECVLPFVVLDARRRAQGEVQDLRVSLHYPQDRFTSQIFIVQVEYANIAPPTLSVRIEAFVRGTRDRVGHALECDARDPHTGLVTLRAGQRVHVPIRIEPDFSGDAVEVRVNDAIVPERSYARLVLQNACLR